MRRSELEPPSFPQRRSPTLRAARLALLLATIAGCAGFGDSAPFDPESFRGDPDWLHVTKFPLVSQEGRSDCGAAALSAVLTYWNLPVSREDVLRSCSDSAEGIRAGDLRTFVRDKGLKAYLIEGGPSDLENELSRRRPVLVGLAIEKGDAALTHYEVVIGLHRKDRRVVTLDPARGWRSWSWEEFDRVWSTARRLSLVCFKGDN